MSLFAALRPRRRTTMLTAVAAAAVGLTVPAAAIAGHDHSVPPPPAAPTSAGQIQNIDQVKTAIKGYYGDTTTTTPAPGDAGVTLHQFDPNGAYAKEVGGIAADGARYLDRRVRSSHGAASHGKPAILLDIDDTTLNTYSYEIYSNFVYNPTTNANFVNAGSTSVFPAVPGMVDLEKRAAAEGYTVFFLTGRPASQLDGTNNNLKGAGYTYDPANLYLKDTSAPWLQWCMTDADGKPCTTIEYKSSTRKHIESQGFDIVANFGDQYSDLSGGYADQTFKLPNPMYYLP